MELIMDKKTLLATHKTLSQQLTSSLYISLRRMYSNKQCILFQWK